MSPALFFGSVKILIQLKIRGKLGLGGGIGHSCLELVSSKKKLFQYFLSF